MKSKCSFTLKALTALVLAVVMLFGTVATTIAATVDIAETGWPDVYFVGDPISDWSSGIKMNTNTSTGRFGILVYLDAADCFALRINNAQRGPSTDKAAPGQKASGSYAFLAGVSGLYKVWYDQNNNGENTPWVWIESFDSGTAYVLGQPGLGLGDWTDNEMTGDKTIDGYRFTSYATTAGNWGFKVRTNTSNWNNQWPSGASNYTISGVTVGAKITYFFYPQTNTLNYTLEHAVSTSNDGNGGLTANKSYVANGSSVKFTLTPNSGYEVATFTVNGVDCKGGIDGNNEYTYNLSSNSAVNASVTYQLKTYTISYAPGAFGSGTVASTSKRHGSPATLSSSTFTRTGYDQDGWSVAADDGIKAYDLGDTTNYVTEGNATLYPHWTEVTAGIALTAYTNGAQGTTGGTIQVGGANADAIDGVGIDTSKTIEAVAKTAQGYDFMGWETDGTYGEHIKLYVDSECTDEYTPTDPDEKLQTTIYIKTDGYGANVMTNANSIVKANFNSIYYLTLYNVTYDDDEDPEDIKFVYLSAPPRSIDINGTQTFTYKVGTVAERGEDNQFANSGIKTEDHIITSGEYCEGNKLKIHHGDSIVLHYSALSSSDIIAGVFFNNAIRYSTELEPDNLYYDGRTYNTNGSVTANGRTFRPLPEGDYTSDDDWNYDYTRLTTLAADPLYYRGATIHGTENLITDAIATATSNATNPYPATVDQALHTVTFTATQNYYNIDLELATKKQIVFSDTKNTVLHHITTDNFFGIGDHVYKNAGTEPADQLTVQAKGNSDQTNTITTAGVKLYYYNASTKKFVTKAGIVDGSKHELESPDNTLTVAASNDALTISNVGATPSTDYIIIGGTMPNTDVYVELDLSVSYQVTMKSKIQSDLGGSKEAFLQVAPLVFNGADVAKNDSATTATETSPATITEGSKCILNVGTIDGGYMFVAWYKSAVGASAPDYENGLLSEDEYFEFEPSENCIVWAVGTKDLFINGSKFITGKDTDWYSEDGSWKNQPLEYDPVECVYYWEIDDTMFSAAGRNYKVWKANNKDVDPTSLDYGLYFAGDDGFFYWNNNDNAYHGKSYFQLLDTDTGYDYRTIWQGITSFVTDSTTNPTIGKVLKRDQNQAGTTVYQLTEGQGFINFEETGYAGYSTPIRIYYNPAGTTPATKLYAKAAPIYPHIYLSDGYKRIDETYAGGNPVTFKVNDGTLNSNDAAAGAGNNCTFNTTQWNSMTEEGTVRDITIKSRDAKLTVYKDVANANYMVSSFFVYNIDTHDVFSYTAKRVGETNEYYTDEIKTHEDEALYIVPIVEYNNYDATHEKMTVTVNAKDLNKSEWGDLVACYAWYAGDTGGETPVNYPAYGRYPGQLMVAVNGGDSFKATFPAHSPTDNSALIGIIFTNYVSDANNSTWLKGANVMGAGNIIPTYNHIERSGTDKQGNAYTYTQTNSKNQTYDYREPIAYFNNRGDANEVTISFTLESGNGDLIAWTHDDMVGSNIRNYDVDNGYTGDWPVSFEHLTDAKGSPVDLNGVEISVESAPSYYICAKGMVSYTANDLSRVFYSANKYQTTSGSVNDGGVKGAFSHAPAKYDDYVGYTADDIDMSCAVQWYIYNSSGEYITNILSAAIADKSSINSNNTVVAQTLIDLGYAVDGRSVAICYDVPRNCSNAAGDVLGAGTGFDAYRFTGQWLQKSVYDKAYVYGEVALNDSNGIKSSGKSTDDFGEVTVKLDKTNLTHKGALCGTGTEGDVNYAFTTAVEGDKGAITLTASATNFLAWYIYDESKGWKEYSKTNTITPIYTENVTYYAVYESKANYKYMFNGRETDNLSFTVSGGYLDKSEMVNGNTISTSRTDFGTKAPGENTISIFKKTITWITDSGRLTSEDRLNNDTDVVGKRNIQINNAVITDEKFTLTAYYPNSVENCTYYPHDYSDPTYGTSIPYNTAIDMNRFISTQEATSGHTIRDFAQAGHVFVGWVECNENGSDIDGARVLSTQGNFGQVIVKNTYIKAVFGESPYGSEDSSWEVFIDDTGVTREMYSETTGRYYNDVIVCARPKNSTSSELPSGARVGALFVEDGGVGSSINTANLATYASKLSESNGRSGMVGGRTVTNVYATSITAFGRVDLAAKYKYEAVKGHNYYVYVYYFDGSSYHFYNTEPGGMTSGSYSVYTPPVEE